MQLQELNQDGSPRLDDNGDPIIRTYSEGFCYRLLNTPVGKRRYLIADPKDSILKPVTKTKKK
jgi:hypothetical protein